ncbi:MAG: tRNA (adenosine(37)-N6)-threonylcarbamoyltransferase complex ATPase subunit type 1 TsaE [Desulfobacteraceae bacterium]|nr:tRNA (adenosine(37)-N6)-threonylcarbamoyltransferase complex ATPase subunit type 1 TsaE [Desulfobacteraceae bacterium]
MEDFQFDSPCEECSLLLGQKIGELLLPGDILALWGELAAGKTLLTRGIALGLGVSPETRVTSPTFTIINEYSGRLHLYHLDLYRLSGPDDLEDLPWEETLFGSGVAVIEWPDRLERFLPDKRWDFKLTAMGDESRRIVVTGLGRANRERMAEWVKEMEAVGLDPACSRR